MQNCDSDFDSSLILAKKNRDFDLKNCNSTRLVPVCDIASLPYMCMYCRTR